MLRLVDPTQRAAGNGAPSVVKFRLDCRPD
jgi:hypothetical protein